MNILLISHFMLPHIGGVETATYNTAKTLSSLGHNVVVMTSKCKGENRKFHKMHGFLVYRFRAYNPPELKHIPQLSHFGIMPKAFFKFKKIIKRHEIQVIHAEGRLFPISFSCALLNQMIFKRPMFVSVQGRLSQSGITDSIEKVFDKIITRLLYRKLKRIICVSNSLKARFLSYNIRNEKLIVIPNGVDISEFAKKSSSNFFNKYHFFNDKPDYKKVVFVGRLDAQKGVEYLIRAIPNVVKEYKKVHFIILGNGNLEKKLKKLAKKLDIKLNVTFIDMIPLEKMPEFYSSVDIFCLPSIHEGFPLSIAEAMSVGLVIVASAVEGIPEAIIEDKNGFLVGPKNVSQLSKKLIKALNLNDQEIKEIQRNNIKLAKEKYSWEALVKRIVDVYKNSLTGIF